MADSEKKPQYILSLSYGKDSLACLGAIEKLGLPLDRIVHAEVWATDTIPADLPPMVEFKAKADEIIKERWGIQVEHVCAMTTYEKLFYKIPEHRKRENPAFEGMCRGFPFQKGAWCQRDLKVNALTAPKKYTYEDLFYSVRQSGVRKGSIVGFPFTKQPECNSALKRTALREIKSGETIQYLGIAADERERIARHTKPRIVLPLVDAGWDEAFCRRWCEENDLLSPIYTDSKRGGCWFCHNQSVEQLRLLRKNYPDLWALLLKWDADSPVTFKASGHTVRDFDLRFQAEDEGRIPTDRTFRWKML